MRPTRRSPCPLCRWPAFAFLGVLVACAAVAAGPESLANRTPADVGFFAEIRNAADLLVPLAEPQIWSALAEVAGQPAAPEEASDWRNIVRQSVQMEPAEAVEALLARQVAFVGERPGRSQDAIVMCRPARDSNRAWIEKWRAKPWPVPGAPPTYQLLGAIGVATPADLLVFGDLAPQDGTFQRTLQFLARNDKGSLGADPTFRELLGRVPPDPDGLVFVRFVDPPASQPAPATAPAVTTQSAATRPASSGLLGPFRGADAGLLALHRDGRLLRLTAVSDRATAPHAPRRDGAGRLLRRLPASVLFAWSGRVELHGLPAAVERLPERNVFRAGLKLVQPEGTFERLVGALNEEACVAIGLVRPASRAADAPPVPALALLIDARSAVDVETEALAFARSLNAFYELLSLQRGAPGGGGIEERSVGRTQAWLLDLSGVISGIDLGAIGELHVCWALHDDTLVVATHFDFLRAILASRAGDRPDLSSALALAGKRALDRSDNTLVAQTAAIADAGEQWLAFFRDKAPELLEESWWRTRQPGGGSNQLGIDVVQEGPRRRLLVRSVQPNGPSAGRIEVGDYVLGAGARRFTSTTPVIEMRRALEGRSQARWIDLLISRDGRRQRVRVPLPFVNPLDFLRRAVAIGELVDKLVYTDEVDDRGARGFLTIEPRRSPAPSPPMVAPIGEPPASQPR